MEKGYGAIGKKEREKRSRYEMKKGVGKIMKRVRKGKGKERKTKR